MEDSREHFTIEDVSRSVITATHQGRRYRVQVEAFERGFGSPDFLLYPTTLECLDSTGEHIFLTEEKQVSILEQFVHAMSEKNQTVEIEKS